MIKKQNVDVYEGRTAQYNYQQGFLYNSELLLANMWFQQKNIVIMECYNI